MDLSIQTLRIFCKVVEEGSFSGAARVLGITQPTVSQQISRVEDSIGGRAFERVGKQIHLTPLGQQFYQFANELVEKAERADRNYNAPKSSLIKVFYPSLVIISS